MMGVFSKKNIALIFLFLILCIFSIFLFFQLGKYIREVRLEKDKQEEAKKTDELIQKTREELNRTDFLARAFSIYDMTLDKNIYAKNEVERLPLASLAKIMTAVVAIENTVQEPITISEKSLSQYGEYSLVKNELWRKEDLIKFTLITSSNDAAHALSEIDENFIQQMNRKATELDMKDTFFYNPTGLDISKTTSGGYSSTNDINKLVKYSIIKYPDIFQYTAKPELDLVSHSKIHHIATNTNLSLNKIPNLIFSKTGLTTLAGGNIVVAFQTPNQHTIIVTLLGSSATGRFSDIEKITKILYNNYR